MDYHRYAKKSIKGLRAPDSASILATSIKDKDDLASMLVEALHYARVGAMVEKGPGIRAINQILDILIDMGYEGLLKNEGKGRIHYLTHPFYGDWTAGKFENEGVFKKEIPNDLWSTHYKTDT